MGTDKLRRPERAGGQYADAIAQRLHHWSVSKSGLSAAAEGAAREFGPKHIRGPGFGERESQHHQIHPSAMVLRR